jgi:hypothetical protein
MGYENRLKLIGEIEQLRQSKVICYLTSLRPNVNAMISEDAVRVMFDQMLLLADPPVEKLDLFLCSNGGVSTVPWRLIALLREFATKVSVLLPYRAYSAATLIALGADEIVMHPFAEMGPIDPTVANDYNPVDPNGRRVGISVEDVKAFVAFIKSTVGIQQEDQLVKTIQILCEKVHPLALGNVERSLSQSRMVARKILRTHMPEDSSEKIDEIVENLASKLYFHGHPINRKEARQELGLKVLEKPGAQLETALWKLYEDFEQELENQRPLDPMGEICKAAPPPAPNPNVGAYTIPPGTNVPMTIKVAVVESAKRSSIYKQDMRFVLVATGQSGEPMVRQETLAQQWEHSAAPQPPQN